MRSWIQPCDPAVFDPLDDIEFAAVSPCGSVGTVEETLANHRAVNVGPLWQEPGVRLSADGFDQMVVGIHNRDASVKLADHAKSVAKVEPVWRVEKIGTPRSEEASTAVEFLDTAIPAICDEKGTFMAGPGIDRHIVRAIKTPGSLLT